MSFLTEDEIVTDLLLRTMSEKDKLYIKNLPERAVVMLHHSTGMWIRNHYKLWDKENPHVKLDDARHDLFPDQISGRILEKLWARLGNEITFRVDIIEHKTSDNGTSYEFKEVPTSSNYRPETEEDRYKCTVAIYGEEFAKWMNRSEVSHKPRGG